MPVTPPHADRSYHHRGQTICWSDALMDVVNEQVETWEANVMHSCDAVVDEARYDYMDSRFARRMRPIRRRCWCTMTMPLELNATGTRRGGQRMLRLLQDFKSTGSGARLGIQSQSHQMGLIRRSSRPFLTTCGHGVCHHHIGNGCVDKRSPPTSRAVMRWSQRVSTLLDHRSHTLRQDRADVGLTDKYTWLNTVDFARRADGLPVRAYPG